MAASANSCRAGSIVPTVIVVMGVSGCGKSTVAALLAQHLHCPFYEGDTYHPPANVEKMRSGIPLTDADRAPWLAELAAIVEQHCSSRQPAVLSCSALKPAYRQQLRGRQPLVTAHMQVMPNPWLHSKAELASRGPESISSGSSEAGAADLAGEGFGFAQSLRGSPTGEATREGGAAGSRKQAVPQLRQQQSGTLQEAGDSGGSTSGTAAMGVRLCTAATSERQQPCGSSAAAGMGPCSDGRKGGIGFVLLEPSREQLQQWLAQRAAAGAHFMPPSLLDSQLGSLQYDPNELYCHVKGHPFPAPSEVVGSILQQLGGAGGRLQHQKLASWPGCAVAMALNR